VTACFKLMKALQPANDPKREICEACVYFNCNLDQSFSLTSKSTQPFCGLDFTPGDDRCVEMRTNNCGAGRSKD
jgi:hypothetical protein